MSKVTHWVGNFSRLNLRVCWEWCAASKYQEDAEADGNEYPNVRRLLFLICMSCRVWDKKLHHMRGYGAVLLTLKHNHTAKSFFQKSGRGPPHSVYRLPRQVVWLAPVKRRIPELWIKFMTDKLDVVVETQTKLPQSTLEWTNNQWSSSITI